MIPKITQERPNVAPKYWCGTCGHALPPPNGPETCPNPVPWKFCSICGEPIEYDKAEPVRWVEQNCERCGRSLIRKSPADMAPPDFIASPDYVGTSLCRNCMEEHCVQTNCLQCEIGHWPICPYTYIKRLGLEKHADGAANNE